MLRQARQGLEQNREAVQFVPEGQHDAELLDVVTARVTLEEIRLASFLLLYVDLSFLTETVLDEGLHEVLREDRAK